MLAVCLDAGHGGTDSGAAFLTFREDEIALTVVEELGLVLENKGCTVTTTRKRDEAVSLRDRVRQANLAAADVFISLHLNADVDPDKPGDPVARGSEIWHYPNSIPSRALAVLLGEELGKLLPPFRGVKTSDRLYVLKHTYMPAVLLELGFIDSLHDATLLSGPHFVHHLADRLAASVLRWAFPPETDDVA